MVSLSLAMKQMTIGGKPGAGRASVADNVGLAYSSTSKHVRKMCKKHDLPFL
jgi:cytidylate kinase